MAYATPMTLICHLEQSELHGALDQDSTGSDGPKFHSYVKQKQHMYKQQVLSIMTSGWVRVWQREGKRGLKGRKSKHQSRCFDPVPFLSQENDMETELTPPQLLTVVHHEQRGSDGHAYMNLAHVKHQTGYCGIIMQRYNSFNQSLFVHVLV